jgi:hypothetical protein
MTWPVSFLIVGLTFAAILGVYLGSAVYVVHQTRRDRKKAEEELRGLLDEYKSKKTPGLSALATMEDIRN